MSGESGSGVETKEITTDRKNSPFQLTTVGDLPADTMPTLAARQKELRKQAEHDQQEAEIAKYRQDLREGRKPVTQGGSPSSSTIMENKGPVMANTQTSARTPASTGK